MKTGAGITTTLAFGASLMGGSSSQSSSSDESAAKKLKITGTTHLTTTDFTTSTKVNVDKSVLEGETKGAQWYDETEEEKAEKTRAKEAREAIKNEANKEAREGRQNAIAEANAIGKANAHIGNRIAQDAKDAKAAMKAEKKEAKKEERKEERKEKRKRVKEAKEEERKRVKEAKEVERKRVKEAKEVERKRVTEEKTKAALEITKSQGKSKGVNWNKSQCKWVVAFHEQQKGSTLLLRRHLGYFDDRAEAVAAYSSYSSMTKEERKARSNSQ
jgi:hypothetical protein